MPIPSPKGKEKENMFVSRCAGDKVMNKDYPDQKQRLAICYSQWKKAKKKKKTSGSTKQPTWEEHNIGDDDGGCIILL